MSDPWSSDFATSTNSLVCTWGCLPLPGNTVWSILCPRRAAGGNPGTEISLRRGRIALWKSIVEGFRYKWSQLPPLVRLLSEELDRIDPDLLLTDFEPALPRAADAKARPYVSLTHQHFLVAFDFSILPTHLKIFAWMTGLAVPLHYRTQSETIISSFFEAPLRKRWLGKATTVGPMIRPEVRQGAYDAGLFDPEATAKNADDSPKFLLSYLRRQSRVDVVSHLQHSPLPVKVYGLGSRDPEGAITFHEVHPERFVEDLLACHGVVKRCWQPTAGGMYVPRQAGSGSAGNMASRTVNQCPFSEHMGCGDLSLLKRSALRISKSSSTRSKGIEKPFGKLAWAGTEPTMPSVS